MQAEMKYGGFWRRLAALMIDALIVGTIGAILSRVHPLLGNIIAIVYFIGFWTWRGQTPGKIALGLKIVRTDGSPIGFGRAVLRFISYIVSAITIFIGFLMIVWDGRRQGLHDKIAGTYVVDLVVDLQKEGAEKKGGWKGLPFYTRVTIAGLLIFALIFQGVGILATVSGGVERIDEVEAIIFISLLFVIPTLVIVGLTWRSGRTLIAAIWAVLMLLMNAQFIPHVLGNFNSFVDGGVMVPLIASLIVAGVAGTVAFLQHRRGTTRNVSTAGERWVLWATTAMVVGLMVVSGTLHVTSLKSVSPEEKAEAISVDMKNDAFRPAQLTVPASKPAKFVIKNRDLTVHTFTIEELGIDVKVLPGSEELIELSSPPAGTYVYLCTFLHSSDPQSGTLVRGTLVMSEP